MHVVRAHTLGTRVVSLAMPKGFLRVDSSDEDTTITALLDAVVVYRTTVTAAYTAGTAVFHVERWRNAALAYGPVTAITNVKYDDVRHEQTVGTDKYYISAATDGADNLLHAAT